MSELASTDNAAVQWADEISESRKKIGTEYFLFPHLSGRTQEMGDLVIAEPDNEIKSDCEHFSSIAPISQISSTVATKLDKVRVPRAQRVSFQTDQRYILLKKYEGFITACGKHSFVARLFENNSDYPVLEAEFDLEEISETDRNLVIEGAALVWTIGYRYDGSTRKRESAIYLRRLPAWTEKEVEQAKNTTIGLTGGIRWE